MRRERCKFCGAVLEGHHVVHRYSFAGERLAHCDQRWCRAKGKEWRLARFKDAAEALGLAEKLKDSRASEAKG